MPSRFLLAPLIATIAFLNGCSYFKYPDVHKVTVPQGNIVEQKMIDKLRLGMTRSQVRYILGTPLLMDTFDQGRWDYYFSVKRPGKKERYRKITVFFEGNTLTHFINDYQPNESNSAAADEVKTTATDEVKTTATDEMKTTATDEVKTTATDEVKTTATDEVKTTATDEVKDDAVIEAQALPPPPKLETNTP